jgi:hypothetical protein
VLLRAQFVAARRDFNISRYAFSSRRLSDSHPKNTRHNWEASIGLPGRLVTVRVAIKALSCLPFVIVRLVMEEKVCKILVVI